MTSSAEALLSYHRNGVSGQGFFTALTPTTLTIEWDPTTPDDSVGSPAATWGTPDGHWGPTSVEFTDAAHHIPLAVLARLDAARTDTLPTFESGYHRHPDLHRVLAVADGPLGIAIFDTVADGLARIMVAFTDLTDPDDDLHRTAVFDLPLLVQQGTNRFGHNSWRGDRFHHTVLAAHRQAVTP